jgi:hypothetical protein
MYLRKLSLFALFALLAASFSGCEKVEYFKSEKSIRSELNDDWRLVPIPRNDNELEIWTFSDNVVTRTVSDRSGRILSVLKGVYSLNVKLMKTDIIITGFTEGMDHLNGDWRIVQLDKDFLIIATDHYDTTGILEREFVRIK